MGIHNEAGNKRVSPVPPMDQLIDQLITMITSTEDKDRSYLPFRGRNRDQVVALVNNLGGFSELELGSLSGEVSRQLKDKGLSVQRFLSGTFMVRRKFVMLTRALMTDCTQDEFEHAGVFDNSSSSAGGTGHKGSHHFPS